MSTTVYSQVVIYIAESTGESMERTKMRKLRNSSKGGFEPGLTWLRVRRSTAELPRSMNVGGTRKRDSGCARGMYNISENPARIKGELRGESWSPRKFDIELIVIHHPKGFYIRRSRCGATPVNVIWRWPGGISTLKDTSRGNISIVEEDYWE